MVLMQKKMLMKGLITEEDLKPYKEYLKKSGLALYKGNRSEVSNSSLFESVRFITVFSGRLPHQLPPPCVGAFFNV